MVIHPVFVHPDGHADGFFTVQPNVLYGVQATTDFVNWQNLITKSVLGSLLDFVDLEASQYPFRFYRLVPKAGSTIADMVYFPPGTFTMGSPASEAQRDPGETQHRVTLTRGFWMGKYEVTQGEYLEVMGSNPSFFRNGVAPPSVGDDVRRLSICLYPCHVRPTEEIRVSSPRLLQMETLWPSASEHSPRPSTFGAAAVQESAVITNHLGMHRSLASKPIKNGIDTGSNLSFVVRGEPD